jgi:hypothetical protein
MATVYWRPAAKKVAQIDKVRITAADVATTINVKYGNKTFSLVMSATAAATATALAAMLEAVTEPEFEEQSYAVDSVATDTVNFTADTLGTPFTTTVTVTGGAGTITHTASSTANVSPNDVNDVNNWSSGALPGGGDTVILEGTGDENVDEGMWWNLGALSAIALTLWRRYQSFAATIGLPDISQDATAYREYRGTHLRLNCTTITLGEGVGPGPGRERLDMDGVASTVNVYESGSSKDDQHGAIQIKETNGAVNVFGGSVDIAMFPGETATVTTLNITPGDGSTPDVQVGSGTTITTIAKYGGELLLQTATATTITNEDGDITVNSTGGTYTTFNVNAGTVHYNSTSTITTLNLIGAIDFSTDNRARTVTNKANFYPGWSFNDPNATVALAAGFVTVGCRLSDGTTDFGRGRTFTPS